MNEKFFSLPEEKRLAIINAGYRVFSQNSYKKSPVSEIADAAGISKSLLFHYFRNKRELYLFLIKNASDTTYIYLRDFGCDEKADFFEIMHRGLKAKVALMKKYPDLTMFTLRAYYETDPEVFDGIREIIGRTVSFEYNRRFLENIDPRQFAEGIDLQMMYMDMYLASEGYLWEKSQHGRFDPDRVEKDFEKMIEFWKKIYLRKE